MIGETLIDYFFGMLHLLFGSFQMFSLPTEAISVLGNICAYGNWIVGLDVVGLFVGSVLFWWAFHMSIGLIVWVWNRLPLT